MIEYRKGDLLADKHPVIAHGVNLQGVMGAGIAKAIKKRWPEVNKRYKEWLEPRSHFDVSYNLGRVIPCPTKDGTIVLNCITQVQYGRDNARYVSYDAIDDCMDRIDNWMTDQLSIDQINGKEPRFLYIAMPKIGAGLGGGEWSIIESIINYRLKDHKVVVYEL